MINAYCDSLKGFFAQLVFYGIIDESDAQCFRVETRIESASYILAAAAVLLALLNSFVMNAALQYFRDKDSAVAERHLAERKLEGSVADDMEELNVGEMREKITPVPVLFTDRYRWFLSREHAMVAIASDSPSDSNRD
jgi:hypothetical protein